MIVENPPHKENQVNNSNLKLSISKLFLKESKMKRNTCIAFSPQNEIAFGFNTTDQPRIIKFQNFNPNDHLFIQKFSYLIKDKANDLIEMQNKENLSEVIAKIYTVKFRDNLINIINNTIENEGNNQGFLKEARAYLVLWIFFEYWIVFYDEINHLLTIRNFFYKYIFETDLENFGLFKTRNLSSYTNNIRIETLLTKLKFLMRICDFLEMQNILGNLSYLLKYDRDSQINYPGVNLEFAEIFDHFLIICEHYNQVINRGEDNNLGDFCKIEFNRNIQTINQSICKYLECIHEVTFKTNLSQLIRNNIAELIREVHLILAIFNGDVSGIREICENYKEWILMNIYYRFHSKDFYDVLKEGLSNYENYENDKLDKLIKSTIVNQAFEFYQNLKDKVPKWLQFHFMDILYDLEILTNEFDGGELLDGMSLRNFDYMNFLNYLMLLEVSFEDFINYSTLYDNSTTTGPFLIFLEKMVIKNVLAEFRKFEMKLITKKNLKAFLKKVLDQLNIMRNGLFIIKSVTKISFEKFLELQHYKEAVYFYSFNNLGKLNYFSQDDDCFDKLLNALLLSENFPEGMKKLTNSKTSIKNRKFEFLIKLINFWVILEDYERLKYSYDAYIKIKEFFEYCFVHQNCPKLMWLYTLRLFSEKHQENFELFREIKYENYKSAFDNHCSYETCIKNEMRKFFSSNRNSKKLKMDDDVEDFLEREFYSLTQFLFENQIISYTR